MDSNATAMPIVTALAFNGDALDTLLSGLDAAAHYGNGMNLYVYLGSNPVNRLDALGLSWGDPFDEVDAIMADISGEKIAAAAAAMESIGAMFEVGTAMAMIAIQFVPGGTAALIGVQLAMGNWEGALEAAAFGGAMRGAKYVARMLGRFGKMRFLQRGARAGATGSRFGAGSGELYEQFVVNGQKLDFAGSFTGSGTMLIIRDIMLYPAGGSGVPPGLGALRGSLHALAREGFEAGYDTVKFIYNRAGSTGGVRGRLVELVFRR